MYNSDETRYKIAGILSHISDKSKENILEQINFKSKADKIKNVKLQSQSTSNSEYNLIIESIDDRVIVTGISDKSYKGKVIVPEGVTHIGNEAFRDSLACEISLPESLEYIGDWAFSYTNFKNMILPSKIYAVPHHCFEKSCVESINLDNITSIGNYSFSGTNIKSITLNANVVQVGIKAFENCLNLETFKHDSTLRKIRDSAFKGCIKLVEFDYTGVSEIEGSAFEDTNVEDIDVSGEVTYIKPFTFTSERLKNVKLGEGCYKIADHSFVNTNGNPIVYTVSNSVGNIGVAVFNKEDTVRCCHHSIAESCAKIAGCTIEYIDDSKANLSNTLIKAKAMSLDIPTLIGNMITDAYSKSDYEYEYDIDESKLMNIPINSEFINYLGIDSIDTPDGYSEKPKFKVLLEHYSRSCDTDGFGLTSKMINLRDTFTITHSDIYNDGVSRVLMFVYNDHKFESKNSKYIIALTGNTVRYCCMCNRNTDIYCNDKSKDLSKLINVLTPGDTIGYDCIIAGDVYKGICGKSTEKNNKGELLSVNIFQAIFNCSIAVKLDRNNLALIIPGNNKVILCASLGKSVWNNENDESYKVKYCKIVDIQDIKTNTIFNYKVESPTKDDSLFKEIKRLNNAGVQDRIVEYSVIGKSEISAYKEFSDYCNENDINCVEDLDLRGLGYLLSLPIVEIRRNDWFDASVDRTIVRASKYEIPLHDGTTVYQYKTVKRVAMRNKLITGGDKTIYVYEVYNVNLVETKIIACTMEIDKLFELARNISLNNSDSKEYEVYRDKDKLDVVEIGNVELVTPVFASALDRQNESYLTQSFLWLTVYKPNGRYYVSYIFRQNGRAFAVLLIQVGDFNVLLDYVDCANNSSATGYDMLIESATVALGSRKIGLYRNSNNLNGYKSLMRARSLAIDGETDIKKYLATGASPVICHMLGIA